MKLFSFPQATLEKAIHKRILGLAPEHREWFTARWAQKPYKKAFIENKAMPLVTLLAKGKTCDDADFAQLMADWNVTFYEAEDQVLRPMIDGDGLMQLMQKNMPSERKQSLLDRLSQRPASSDNASTAT